MTAKMYISHFSILSKPLNILSSVRANKVYGGGDSEKMEKNGNAAGT